MPPAATAAPGKKGQHNDFVHTLLEQAQELQDEKKELFERIGANRDLLRNVKTTGLLSQEQAKAADEFYPPRKAKDEGDDSAPAAS